MVAHVAVVRMGWRWVTALLVALSFVIALAPATAFSAENRSKKPVASKSVKKAATGTNRKTVAKRKNPRKKAVASGKSRNTEQRHASRHGSPSKMAASGHSVVRASAVARQTVGESLGLRGVDDPQHGAGA